VAILKILLRNLPISITKKQPIDNWPPSCCYWYPSILSDAAIIHLWWSSKAWSPHA